MAEIVELDRLWRGSGPFRSAAQGLIALSPEHHEALRASLPGDGGTPPDDLDDRGWRAITNAYRTLYALARDFGSMEIANRVVELASESASDVGVDASVANVLSSVLRFNPEAEREIALQDAEYGMLPIVSRIQTYLDLRAVSAPTEDDDQALGNRVELIPAIVMRINFDESVGGSDAIAVQLPWSQIASLLEQMGAVVDQRRALRSILPPSLTVAQPWLEEVDL